jgi:hypothetical protein
LIANPFNNAFSDGFTVTLLHLIPKLTNSNPESCLKIFFQNRGYLLPGPVLISNHSFKKIKRDQMKKLLFVLVIGAAFAACNNAAETTEAAADTAAAKVDSAVTAVADTAAAKIDSAAAKVDSVAAKVDSTKKN